MKGMVSGYLNVLFQQDASSVGGKLPDDGFYFIP
jgi:NitT/TauT family transport system substrate-binding protein